MLHPNDVAIGAQYDPASITGLRRLTGYQLVSRVCDFSRFINLVELDISNNKLTDIANIGLHGHRHLRIFCAMHNGIATSLAGIAALLESMSQLEIVCLRENPVMHNAEDRLRLLSLMHSQRTLSPTLHTLDSAITLSERIDAWKLADDAGNDPERMRFSAVFGAFLEHQPESIAPSALTTLDLSHADLGFVDLTDLLNLRELILVGNRIESLDACEGLERLQQLEVLDLRHNLLPRLEPIAELVAKLSLLETLGIAGNKCAPANSLISLRDLTATGPSYRVRFLTLLPDAQHVRGHSLAAIDTKEITMEERAHACKADPNALALLSASLPNYSPQELTDRRSSTLSGNGGVGAERGG